MNLGEFYLISIYPHSVSQDFLKSILRIIDCRIQFPEQQIGPATHFFRSEYTQHLFLFLPRAARNQEIYQKFYPKKECFFLTTRIKK